MKQDKTALENPWAGLSSYEDPVKAERPLKFCGRESDTYDLTRLVDDNFIVTLYGKSGVGKTSLLNAGVFPALRHEQYTPLSLRLGMTDETLSFQEVITAAIEHTIAEDGGSIDVVNVVEEQTDLLAVDYLWNWFARRLFVNAAGQTTFPVVVFDQFEEVFRQKAPLRKAAIEREQSDASIDSAEREQSRPKVKADVLLAQLHYLADESHALNDCVVNGEEYSYDFNFRFVLSIREDDLYRLEDCIDNNSLTALKRCRYRLRSLSDEGARDVILVPGEGLFKQEEQDAIVKAIIDKSRNEDGSISTNIVSLLCNRIFVDFQKTNADHITPALVDNFIQGNPFERFYNEATRGFSNKEKSYIEDNLVDSTGRRNSIPESDFLKHVPNGASLLTGDTRILQRTSTSSDGSNYRIELIHDSFCRPVSILKRNRLQRKKITQRILAGSIFLLVLSIIAFLRIQYLQNWKLQKTKARYISIQAENLINEGNSYMAKLLLLNVLPSNIDDQDFPYTEEAERAIRTALQHKDNILTGQKSGILSFDISKDGKNIISSHEDETIRIWDSDNGICVKTIPHNQLITCVSYSSNGEIFATAMRDGVQLWDAKNGKKIKTFSPQVKEDFVRSLAFSPNGLFIAAGYNEGKVVVWDIESNKVISVLNHPFNILALSFDSSSQKLFVADGCYPYVWDVHSGRLINCFQSDSVNCTSISLSNDNRYFLTGSSYETVTIRDCLSGKIVKRLYGHTGYIYSAKFSPDDRFVVSASGDNSLKIWDVSTGAILKTLRGHMGSVNSVAIDNTGKRVFSSSSDNTIRIWDIKELIEPIKPMVCEDMVNSAIFSPDGSQIASLSDDFAIRLWDAKNGNILSMIRTETRQNVISFCPDGTHIATGDSYNTIRIWDIKDGKCTHVLGDVGLDSIILEKQIFSLEYSLDGKYLLSGTSEGIYLWDTQKNKCVKRLNGCRPASFSSDGRKIVSSDDNGNIRIWDTYTGNLIVALEYGSKLLKRIERQLDPVYFDIFSKPASLHFSPDGMRLVSTFENDVIVWDIVSEKLIFKCKGHSDRVTDAKFSHDGKYIVSVSNDCTIRLWDSFSGHFLGILGRHHHFIEDINFNPNDKTIVTSSRDRSIRLWDTTPLQDLINQTRERFKNRPLTQEERHKYYLE